MGTVALGSFFFFFLGLVRLMTLAAWQGRHAMRHAGLPAAGPILELAEKAECAKPQEVRRRGDWAGARGLQSRTISKGNGLADESVDRPAVWLAGVRNKPVSLHFSFQRQKWHIALYIIHTMIQLICSTLRFN